MPSKYRWDDFTLDLDEYRLERRGLPLSLEPKAIDLLALLVARPHHLFTKQELFERVWADTVVTDHALTRVVAQVRRVLGDDSRDPRYIETVPSRGYRWIAATKVEASVVESVTPGAAVARDLPGVERPPAVAMRAGHVRRLPAALLLAAVAVSGIVAGIGRDAAGPSDLPADVPRPVQLTTHPGLDVHPDLSPLGDAVAYASERSGAFEIYVRGFDGTSRDVAITDDRGHNLQPAWSPDGRFLAYHSAVHGGIWVIPSRGGVPRQVAPAGSKPVWSPDGRRIAFQSDEPLAVTPTAYSAQHGATLRVVDANGNTVRELTQSGQAPGGHGAPAWSPDGQHLAFTVFESGADDGIWMLRLDTLETRPLLRRSGVYEVVFAPDGSTLYATVGDAAILRVPLDPGTGRLRGPESVIQIAGVPGVRGLSIAADGSRLAFGGISLSSQIWAQPVTKEGVAAGPPRPLTNDTSYRNSLPAVSPDGEQIAYISRRAGEPAHVWVMDREGRNRVQLTADDSKDWMARWFPDGRRVAYLSRRDPSPGVWAVDIVTRRDELLFGFDPARMTGAAPAVLRGRLAEVELAPSMTHVAFSLISPPAGRRIVYVSTLDRFSPRAVTDGSVSVGYPAWSPDERRLAVEVKDGASMQAGVVDVATGALRVVTDDRGQTWVRSWSPDGRTIAAAALRNGVWEIRGIDAETGEQATIMAAGPPNVYVRYPEWSRRGDIVVFERGELRGNIWSLRLRRQ